MDTEFWGRSEEIVPLVSVVLPQAENPQNGDSEVRLDSPESKQRFDAANTRGFEIQWLRPRREKFA